MESLEIARKYNEIINYYFNNMTMVLYGSTVFGVQTSDLDVCFFRENSLSEEEFLALENITRKFHLDNNLRIDEEVPYHNKLIYTHDFVQSTFIHLPFPCINGKYDIPIIEKTKEFLASIEMSKRLLLNILTTKHIIIGEDEEKIKEYSIRAWEEILKVVISYCEKDCFSKAEILKCLYENPFNHLTGELYLGYKDNLEEKIVYIDERLETELERLTNSHKLTRTLKKCYVPNYGWLNG